MGSDFAAARLILSARDAKPMLGVLPAEFRFHTVTGAFGIEGAGEPLSLFLKRRTVHTGGRRPDSGRCSSVGARFAEIRARHRYAGSGGRHGAYGLP